MTNASTPVWKAAQSQSGHPATLLVNAGLASCWVMVLLVIGSFLRREVTMLASEDSRRRREWRQEQSGGSRATMYLFSAVVLAVSGYFAVTHRLEGWLAVGALGCWAMVQVYRRGLWVFDFKRHP
jgi:hypothetical protein